MNLWMYLRGNLLNGNSIIEVHFLYLIRDITSDCKQLPVYMLFPVLFEILNPTDSYLFLDIKCQQLFMS